MLMEKSLMGRMKGIERPAFASYGAAAFAGAKTEKSLIATSLNDINTFGRGVLYGRPLFPPSKRNMLNVDP